MSYDAKSKSPPARNPIALRLYKVLGTNYDEKTTREALITLSEFYPAPEILRATSKGKDADRDSDLKTGDELGDASATRVLGGLGSGIAARARKNLRRDVEFKVTQGSQSFLAAFKEVDGKLDILQEHVEAMRVRCDDAHTQLQSTNEACKSLLERAGGLRALRHAVADRQTIVDAFLEHFTLTQAEVETIQSKEIPVGQMFFQSMSRAEKIREDCRVLMAGDEGPTKAGLDIISATSQQLETGYEKIARWCSLEFRRLGRDAQLEVGPVMREAIRWLRKRPELLNEVLAVLSQTRQSTLLGTFMDALTRGGPNGMPRPIEIHAHDPLRYVGDMLAWVHQAIAGEREFLESLFDVKGDGRMVGSVRNFEGGEEEEWIQELMDSAFEKLCSPLKVRVRQTVRSQESCITAYKVTNLLQFYAVTMRRTIGEKAMLSKTLDEITEEAYKAFFDIIEAQARSLARTPLLDNQDVQPPLMVLDHTQVLREIMSVYSASLLGDETAEESRSGFQMILDTMVDAAFDMCTNASELRSLQTPGWDKDVFMLNCLAHLQNAMRPYPFAEYKVQEFQKHIDVRTEELIDDHYHNLLKDAHLDQCILACDSKRPDEPISRIGAMQPPQLENALWHFSAWLSNPEVVQPRRLSTLIDQRLNGRVHRAALQRLTYAYDKICTEVRRPENKYEAANTTLGSQRPFGQMSTLKQILGLENESEAAQDSS